MREPLKVKKRQRGLPEVERVEDFLLLLAGGGEHLEDFRVLDEDDGLFLLLGRKAPSPNVARTFLHFFHDETQNGLGAGVMPYAELGANAAWCRRPSKSERTTARATCSPEITILSFRHTQTCAGHRRYWSSWAS